MALVLTVAQQKGGSGKTTLALQLACQWAAGRKRVALVDSDPQGSLSAWYGARQSHLGEPAGGIALAQVEGWKVGSTIDRLKRDHDVLIVDTAPHAETATRTSVRAADMVVMPMQPSPMDLWATKASLAVAHGEDKPVLVVLNRVPPRGRVVDDIRAACAEEALPVAKTTLGNRTAFVATLSDGLGVADRPRKDKACAEMKALAQEIWRTASRL